MTRAQLIAAVVACGGKAPRVRSIRRDCGSRRWFGAVNHFSWRIGRRPSDPPNAWTPQDCTDSNADLFEGVIRR